MSIQLPLDVRYDEIDLRHINKEILTLWQEYTSASAQTDDAMKLLQHARQREKRAWITLADAIGRVEQNRRG